MNLQDHQIIIGDNLEVMRAMPDDCIDLIYADPPFRTNRDFGDYDDRFSFEDYLKFLADRFVEMRRLLKPTGAVYLHCDHKMSHYIKIEMDKVWGRSRFRNEITWVRVSGAKANTVSRWPESTDAIFYYRMSTDTPFQAQYKPYTDDYMRTQYKHNDNDGRGPYSLNSIRCPAPSKDRFYEYKGYKPPKRFGWAYTEPSLKELDEDGRLWFSPDKKNGTIKKKTYLNEAPGIVIQNYWDDIQNVIPNSAQYNGYSTQKPIELLSRIITASCPNKGIVLDPFVGSGTTVEAAYHLGRYAMGIDINKDTPAIERIEKLKTENFFI